MTAIVPGLRRALTAEHRAEGHVVEVTRETARPWRIKVRSWRAHIQRIKQMRQWRPCRSRCGEFVPWDTSGSHWLEARRKETLLINMVAEAAIRWCARSAAIDSTLAKQNPLVTGRRMRVGPQLSRCSTVAARPRILTGDQPERTGARRTNIPAQRRPLTCISNALALRRPCCIASSWKPRGESGDRPDSHEQKVFVRHSARAPADLKPLRCARVVRVSLDGQHGICTRSLHDSDMCPVGA